jgi:hypothetical protein
MKFKLKNKILVYRISGCVLILALFISCGIEWYKDHGNIFNDEYKDNNSAIIYKTNSVKAGEDAEFIMYIKCASNNDNRQEKLIVAVNVPKVWTDARNAEITWENSDDLGVERKMSPIPDGTSPKSKPGLTWNQALLNKFGGENPNVLDDMQWVAFQADESWTINNGGNEFTLFVKIKIKIKTGPDNLRAKIGFFANYESDGLSEFNADSNQVGPDHWKVDWGDCFEVTDGEGVEPIDFCQYHFNQVTPGNATQNDFLTFRYIGDYYNNQLIDESDIYLNAVATTAEGHTYTVDEISGKTKLAKDSQWGVMWSTTVWPEGFFGVPANETITQIAYYFTNGDGSLYVSKYDDEQVRDANPGFEDEMVRPGRPITPFMYSFVCK